MSKVFVIGSNKTGTTSLTLALRGLGYSVAPEGLVYNKDSGVFEAFHAGVYDKVYDIINRFDAFEDRPYNHTDFYKRLDKKYLGSKFILTLRDTQSWIESYRRWNEKMNLKKMWYYRIVSQTCYGIDDFLGNEEVMRKKYEQRNAAIQQYFTGTGKLLVMDMEMGDGWNVLCPFLEKPLVAKPFPHLNRTV
jgi:hypothetical protein